MSIDVLDIPLFDEPLAVVVDEIVTTCQRKEPKSNRLVSATGAHGLVYAKKNPAFAETLRSFDQNLPDGVPGVWIGRMKGARSMERCYGPDLFEHVLKKSSAVSIGHYFCGGKEGVGEELRNVCRRKFNNGNCVGVFSPPFRELSGSDFKEIGTIISQSEPDIVWIGLSTPKQEMFAKELSKFIKVHYIITVGAAFDFHTARVKQAPKAIQRIGLEWLFRLLIEPKRLFKRYLEIVPLFIYYGVWDLLKTYKLGK